MNDYEISPIATVRAALGQGTDDASVEFSGVDAREGDFLAEVFREEFEQVAVAVGVQARGVEEACVFVMDFGICIVGDGEFEVEGWGERRKKRARVSWT